MACVMCNRTEKWVKPCSYCGEDGKPKGVAVSQEKAREVQEKALTNPTSLLKNPSDLLALGVSAFRPKTIRRER